MPLDRAHLQPLRGSPRDYDALLEAVGDRRVVLIGEASHGTHEFYRERAIITRRLIVEKGFRAVLQRSPQDTEAGELLARCQKEEGPRTGDPKSEGRERIKANYEETAYRELKAELESKK